MGNKVTGKRKHRSRGNSYKNLVVFAIVAVILGAIYFYVHIYMSDPEVVVQENVAEPKYTLLENTDSAKYMAIVLYPQSMNINIISQTFYDSNVFWPYIFMANKEEEAMVANPLDIPAGVIIKIPRVSARLLDPKNKEAINKVKLMADTILAMPEPAVDLPLPF